MSYKDKEFKNLIEKDEREFYPDGSYTRRFSSEEPFDEGWCSEIKEYISDDKYTSGKFYTDKNFSELDATSEKTYNPDGSSVVKLHYVRPKNGIWTKIVNVDADGNIISKTESKEKDI